VHLEFEPAIIELTIHKEKIEELLNLPRDVVSAERAAPPIQREEQGRAALTQLFEEARDPETPIIVERVSERHRRDRANRVIRRAAEYPCPTTSFSERS